MMGFIRRNILRKPLLGEGGQLSLIIILFAAAGLIFFAATLNWSRMVSNKTQLTIASNVGVAALASQVTSYGQSTVETMTDGRFEKCRWNEVFVKILTIIALVAIALIPGIGPALMTAIIVAVICTGVALVVQVAVIEPTVSGMWNKMQQEIKSPVDRAAEIAIQTALQQAATDAAKVPDIGDYNSNGKFDKDGDDIGRFEYHYTKRMTTYVPQDLSAYIQPYKDLRDNLGDLMVKLGLRMKQDVVDTGGKPTGKYSFVVDDLCCSAATSGGGEPVNPQFCNSCCVYKLASRSFYCGISSVPHPSEEIFPTVTSGSAQVRMPKFIEDVVPDGSYYDHTGKPVYDAQYDCRTGSFREWYPLSYDPVFCARIGRFTNPGSLNTISTIGLDDSRPELSKIGYGNKDEDNKDYYNDPQAPQAVTKYPGIKGKDSEGGLFPLLWFLKDTHFYVRELAFPPSDNEACIWCNSGGSSCDRNTAWLTPRELEWHFGGLDYTKSNRLDETTPFIDAAWLPNTKCVNVFEAMIHNKNRAETNENVVRIDDVSPPVAFLAQALPAQRQVCGDAACPHDGPTCGCGPQPNLCPDDPAQKGAKSSDGTRNIAWRPGADWQCHDVNAVSHTAANTGKNDLPYFAGCSKNELTNLIHSGTCFMDEMNPANTSCQCAIDKSLWNDDEIDWVANKLRQLASDAKLILEDKNAEQMDKVDQWGLKAHGWVQDLTRIKDDLSVWGNIFLGTNCGGWTQASFASDDAWCSPATKRVIQDDQWSQNMGNWTWISQEEAKQTGYGGGCTYGTLNGGLQSCMSYYVDAPAYFSRLLGFYRAAMQARNAYIQCTWDPRQCIGCSQNQFICSDCTNLVPGYSCNVVRDVDNNIIGEDGFQVSVCGELDCDGCGGVDCSDPTAPVACSHTPAFKYMTGAKAAEWQAKQGELWNLWLKAKEDFRKSYVDDWHRSLTKRECDKTDWYPLTSQKPADIPPACSVFDPLDTEDARQQCDWTVKGVLNEDNIEQQVGIGNNVALREDDPAFVQYLDDSRYLANRQAPKMARRARYLGEIAGAAQGFARDAFNAVNVLGALDTIDSDVTTLEHLKANVAANPPQLPNWATYVWQTKAVPGAPRGYWHIVKVEAFLPGLPGRCADGKFDCCASTENHGKFPWVRRYTAWRDLGARSCYQLADWSGCVKVRVSRFDEDHTFSSGLTSFMNKLKLWQFSYHAPQHEQEVSQAAGAGSVLDRLKGCAVESDPRPRNDTKSYAFMINKDTDACKAAVEDLLHLGFVQEACARYNIVALPNEDNRIAFHFGFMDCNKCCMSKKRDNYDKGY